MAEVVRFHLDEHGSDALAQALRQLGLDVTTTNETNLSGASDTQHIAFALAHGRVIFTHDADFLRLHATGQAHAGLAYCRHGSLNVSNIAAGLHLIASIYSAEEMRNRVEYLS